MADRTYITDSEAKQTILDIGKRMYLKNFVASNDGNISCRVGDDAIWATPSGVSKGYMSEDMLVKLRLDGTVICSGELPPSSEIKMHLRVYEKNPEVMGSPMPTRRFAHHLPLRESRSTRRYTPKRSSTWA